MPRARTPAIIPAQDDDKREPTVFGIAPEPHRHRETYDPLQTLPGAVIPSGAVGEKLKNTQRSRARAHTRNVASQGEAAVALYKEYVLTLTRVNGDVPEALARVLGVEYDVAAEHQVELHASLLAVIPKHITHADILRELDLSKEARLAMLRKHMFSDVPAASLKAIDMLNELDSGAGSDQTGSYESYVRRNAGVA